MWKVRSGEMLPGFVREEETMSLTIVKEHSSVSLRLKGYCDFADTSDMPTATKNTTPVSLSASMKTRASVAVRVMYGWES